MASIGLAEIIRFHSRRPATIMKFSMQGIASLRDGIPMTHLFSPVRIGRLHAANRILMAPMTRSRADDTGHVAAGCAIPSAVRRAGGQLATLITHVGRIEVAAS